MSNPERKKRQCYVCGKKLPNRMTDRYGDCHAKCAREEMARQMAYRKADEEFNARNDK